MGNFLNSQIKENYIIKDEEADFYNMKGKGPFMVDSFGRKFLKPSVRHRYPYPYRYPYRSVRQTNYPYPGIYNFRNGYANPLQNVQYMAGLHNVYRYNEPRGYNWYP